MAKTPPGNTHTITHTRPFSNCARVARSMVFYGVCGTRGAPKRQKNFCVGCLPPQKTNDLRTRYVCVFVHALIAKPTIGKRMCVFVCNPCVCCVLSVCVFVCNPCVCVCLRPILYTVNYMFWSGMPKQLQGLSF